MRKVLSVIMAAMMILSVINPDIVYASQRDSDKSNLVTKDIISQDSHKHGTVLESNLDLDTGSYYLTENKTITESIKIKSGAVVNLCLNGKTIFLKKKNSPVIEVGKNATLNLYNCTNTNSHITSKDGNNKAKCCVYGNIGSKINIDGYMSLHFAFTGIIFDGTKMTISNKVNIYNNTNNTGNGGGILLKSGSLIMDDTVNIYENNALNGAGIYIERAENVEGGNIYKNEGLENGGGVYVEKTAKIISSKISENIAKNGAGIYIKGTVEELKSEISSNISDYAGGGIFLDHSAVVNSKGLIKSNTSFSGGGAFISNEAILNEYGIITGNTAENGGGVYNEYAELNTFSESVISYNSAQNGGGILAHNITSLNLGGTINNNSAKNGGGLFLDCYRFDDSLISTVTSNGIFQKNTATEAGGAVTILGNVKYTFLGGEYKENTAKNGGAIYVDESTNKTTLISASENLTFERNSAIDGGAFYINKDKTLSLLNTYFKNNIAENKGGSIFSKGNIELGNIYAEENTAGYGSFIYADDGELDIKSDNEFTYNRTKEMSSVIDIQNANTTLQGNMNFIKNFDGAGAESGIYLKDNKYFYITGKITSDTKIPLSVERFLSKGKIVKVAEDFSKYMPEEVPSNYFVSSVNGCAIQCKDGDVYIERPIADIEKIDLSVKNLTLIVDQTYQLSYIVYPGNAIVYDVTWKSSNPDVVKVDKNGLVTALKEGEAIITLNTYSGFNVQCNITVKKEIVHHGEIWKEISDTDNFNINENGYYYFVSDDPFNSTIEIFAEEVYICLNGHSITNESGEAIFKVNSGSNVTITDCMETGEIFGGEYGIINYGNLHFENITIRDIEKSGILNIGGSLNINNVIIKDCLEDGINNEYEDTENKYINISNSIIINNDRYGIYLPENSKMIFSGRISGNSVGIYLENDAKIEFKNFCFVQDNGDRNSSCNVYVEEKADISFNDNFITNSSKIGFTLENLSDENNKLCVISDREIISSLLSDDPKYTLVCGSFGIVIFSKYKLGDLDADGTISMLDVTLLQRLIANMEDYEDFSYDIKFLADLDGDGNISMLDVIILQKIIAGLV